MAPSRSDADENFGNAGAHPPRELGTQLSLSPVMSDVGSTASSPNMPTFLVIPRDRLAPTRQLARSSFLNSPPLPAPTFTDPSTANEVCACTLESAVNDDTTSAP